MNSEERHQARYERRKAQREWVRREKLAEFDNFERNADVNSLIRANFDSRRGGHVESKCREIQYALLQKRSKGTL